MSKNRVGYTIRLNLEDQRRMNMLMDFYNKDPKEITKLALQQLYIATGEVSKKLVQQQETESKETETWDTSSQQSSESQES